MRGMNQKKFTFLTLLIVFGSLFSCLKNKIEPTGEEDVIFSAHDPSAGFGIYQRYVIVDTIGLVDLTGNNLMDTIVDEPYRTIILNQIDINLLSYGYVKVDSVDSADVVINVNALLNPSGELISQYSFVDENGEYEASWWANEYYYGAPDYWGLNAIPLYTYQIPNYFTANSGTLIIEMLDLNSLDTANQKIFVPWFGGVRSVLTGSNIENRLVSAINQCFIQSPYLNQK